MDVSEDSLTSSRLQFYAPLVKQSTNEIRGTAGGFLVSDFNGLLLRVAITGEREVLIDTRDAGISLTDIGYAQDRKLVVIPTLRGNSLMAFTLN